MSTRTGSRTARAAVAGIAGVLTLVVSGCGTGQQPAAQQQSHSSPAGASPYAAAQGSTSSSPAAPAAASQPAGGPVPRRFAATSVTFVSPDEAFVLGTAPCAAPPCTSIVRTLDRGGHWRGLPAPVVPLGRPAARGSAVWGIRFATPAHGFVFGAGLWETTDGGEHWARDARPGGTILSLAAIDGQVLALTTQCPHRSGCDQNAALLRRPLAGGPWRTVANVRYGGGLDPTGLIATQRGTAALLVGDRVLITSDGGASHRVRPTPCTRQGAAYPVSVAVTPADGLALLCIGQGGMGHTDKRVYLSSSGGASWVKAGVPPSAGDGGVIAAATAARLTIATSSAASWLYYSGDRAARWRTMLTRDDAGFGWADLGFTTSADGVVVHGPVLRPSQGSSPGQLLLTGNGGKTWQRARF